MDSYECEVRNIHEDMVQKVQESMPDGQQLNDLAEFFRVLGDPTRIRILNALSVTELCVCDLTAILEMNQSAVSHQLRILRNARLVRYRRDGRTVYYSLDDDHIAGIYAQGLAHIQE